jgi:pyruvate/2-oxoglutarate/acetoin dehydrogenase E1 component
MSTLTAPATATAERTLTYAQALNEALREEMARDGTVLVMGEDIGEHGGIYTVTRGLIHEFGPDRVLDTPISEGAIVGGAMGLALTGYRPVIELMFVDFLFVASDQLFNHVGKARYTSGGQRSVPMVVRTQQGSGGGKAAQHSQSLEVFFCHMPGWFVVAPSNAAEAKGLLKAAIRDDNPVAVLEHKALYFQKGVVPEGDFVVPLGKARVVREGRDVTLISYSKSVDLAVAAAGVLAGEGVEAEVIDLRSLKPLDLDTILASVAKTNRVVLVHEAHRFCGFGAELAATIQDKAFHDLDAPVERVAALDVPIPFGRLLEEAALPQVSGVIAAVRATLDGAR